jgi:hypothetical protein
MSGSLRPKGDTRDSQVELLRSPPARAPWDCAATDHPARAQHGESSDSAARCEPVLPGGGPSGRGVLRTRRRGEKEGLRSRPMTRTSAPEPDNGERIQGMELDAREQLSVRIRRRWRPHPARCRRALR